MIWYPIKQLPENFKESEKEVLLRFPGSYANRHDSVIINGSWTKSSESWKTPLRQGGEPTHFSVIDMSFFDKYLKVVDSE